MTLPGPSTESLQHRTDIAKLISPLRRVRPTVAFYKLAAHRIPTLWSLYRGLLRHAERENVKFRISMLFRENQHTVSPRVARQQLIQGHKWLDIFRKAKDGDTRFQAILDRYDRLIAARRYKERWKYNFRLAIQEEAAIRHRPIFIGSFIRPTLSNKLLPRLRPQPVCIERMIRKRRVARDRRHELRTTLDSWLDDLRHESRFEAELLKDESKKQVFSDALQDWEQPILEKQFQIQESVRLDYQRLMSPYPKALLEAGKRARRRKIENKTRERERERRGEILPATIKRMNKGPPAHVLQKMTPEQIKQDRIVRGPGEAGYTAQVKLKLGMKLKNPDLWKREDGLEEDQDKLQHLEEEIRRENERRRQSNHELKT